MLRISQQLPVHIQKVQEKARTDHHVYPRLAAEDKDIKKIGYPVLWLEQRIPGNLRFKTLTRKSLGPGPSGSSGMDELPYSSELENLLRDPGRFRFS